MAEPKQDSAPACEYLNVHEDAVARVRTFFAFLSFFFCMTIRFFS